MSLLETPQRAIDRRLVKRLRAGEEAALQEYFELYADRLYRMALGRLQFDRDAATGVVHATLCTALENLSGFRGESNLYTWLYACCRQQIADHYRKQGLQAHRETSGADLDQEPAHGLSQEEDLDRRRQRLRVHEALDLLPDSQREILSLQYFEHLSVREIARSLKLSEKAVESRLGRARAAMRRTLDDLESESETELENKRAAGANP